MTTFPVKVAMSERVKEMVKVAKSRSKTKQDHFVKVVKIIKATEDIGLEPLENVFWVRYDEEVQVFVIIRDLMNVCMNLIEPENKIKCVKMLYDFIDANLWFIMLHNRFMNGCVNKTNEFNYLESTTKEKMLEAFVKEYKWFRDARSVKLMYLLRKNRRDRGLRRVARVIGNRLYIPRTRLLFIHNEMMFSPYHPGHFYRKQRSQIGIKMMKN